MIYQRIRYILLYSFLFSTPFLYSYVPYKQVDSTFYTKVNAFIVHAKDRASNEPDNAQLIALLHYCATMSLHKIEKLTHKIHAMQHIPEYVCIAALLQLVLPIVDTFKKTIMNNVTTLEVSKKYWELQREKSISHELLSYMPPVAGLAGQTSKEINDKITQLDADLDEQFTRLGSLALHLDTFDEHQAPDTYYPWIQQVCTLIISAYPDAKLQPCEPSCNEIIKMVLLASKCVIHYPSAFQVHSAPYLMPHSVKQNIAKWIGAAAITFYGFHRIFSEREMLQHRAQQGAENVSKYVNLQAQFIKDTLFEQNEIQNEEAALKAEYETRLLEIHKALSYTKPRESKQEDGVEHHAWENLDPFLKRDFNPLKIKEKANELDPNYLRTILSVLSDMIDKEGQEVGAGVERIGTKMANADYSVRGNLFGTSKESVGEVIAEVGKGLKKAGPLLDTVSKYPKVLMLQGGVLQDKFWTRMIKQHSIGLAILSTVPLYLLLKEGCKMTYALYKKMRGTPTYDAIRETLVDIDLILSIYGDALAKEMAIDDYGRLIYFIDRLKDPQIIKNIPYECRASFASHVQFLESSTLSAAEKSKMIDLMYKRYPFLMHDPRYAAKAA